MFGLSVPFGVYGDLYFLLPLVWILLKVDLSSLTDDGIFLAIVRRVDLQPGFYTCRFQLSHPVCGVLLLLCWTGKVGETKLYCTLFCSRNMA